MQKTGNFLMSSLRCGTQIGNLSLNIKNRKFFLSPHNEEYHCCGTQIGNLSLMEKGGKLKFSFRGINKNDGF